MEEDGDASALRQPGLGFLYLKHCRSVCGRSPGFGFESTTESLRKVTEVHCGYGIHHEPLFSTLYCLVSYFQMTFEEDTVC